MQAPAECLSCRASRASRTLSTNLPAFTVCRYPKDARSIGIGRGTKCRRPMYKRSHDATTPCGSPREGLCARRPTRGRGGRGGMLYIGHRFADDRCLWSEHPCRGASFSAVKLKWSPLGLCAKKESVSILTHPLSGYLISKTSRNSSDSTQVGRSAEAFS